MRVPPSASAPRRIPAGRAEQPQPARFSLNVTVDLLADITRKMNKTIASVNDHEDMISGCGCDDDEDDDLCPDCDDDEPRSVQVRMGCDCHAERWHWADPPN